MAKNISIPVIASGGISNIEDIKKVISEEFGIRGVIVGRAIYDNRIDIVELSKLSLKKKPILVNFFKDPLSI